MARNIEVEINGVTYSGATASAKDQLEMLSLASQNGLLLMVGKGLSDMGVAVAMSSTDMTVIERLKELALKKGNIVRQADGVPVSENLFEGQIYFFLVLIARILEENIGPFWSLNKGECNEEESEQPPIPS
ncbi:hypothetical protein I5K96_08030 [Serratia marcescens]|jgi:hypothetical protein|uniref:hypothetical protein n=1 Tax=Serratia marcescens TaxID=615 RepID=UPI0018D83160|nr:hypothetical protein [Serratia marcescens]MBH2521292.1 hypothetical protein [Serratia marcescens]MBN5203485.1 hypothetical protein [Serratia marcescens]HAT3796571.1 hypothetical protein [Serratia marcescens]HEJ0019575.1 hypothetical protein [Serratia marcescens]